MYLREIKEQLTKVALLYLFAVMFGLFVAALTSSKDIGFIAAVSILFLAIFSNSFY
jgi:uncharacterized membrane protein